ncbi:hypothetical protein Hesp01_65250 [Herbidospora sp. NBRC 101105]|nr:hypothetical protein Hesp01_65250 [Herbidospora sp. NBRC 101105]
MERAGLADQHDRDPELSDGHDGPRHDLFWRVVAAHGVERDRRRYGHNAIQSIRESQ